MNYYIHINKYVHTYIIYLYTYTSYMDVHVYTEFRLLHRSLDSQTLDAEAAEPEIKISIVRVKAQPRKHKAGPRPGGRDSNSGVSGTQL